MRDYIIFYLNGKEVQARGAEALMQMSAFLRYQKHFTGTKVVCAEGDCGACTILVARPMLGEGLVFKPINCCVSPVFLFDACHIVSIEGIKCKANQYNSDALHPVQKSLFLNYGAQCGYCTPGFVMSLVSMYEQHENINVQTIKNHLTGNLCRCTGYQDIITSALAVDRSEIVKLEERFINERIKKHIMELQEDSILLTYEQKKIYIPVSIEEALEFKKSNTEARIIAGATDLGVSINKQKIFLECCLVINKIASLNKITLGNNQVDIGAACTIQKFQKYIAKQLPELYDFLHIFASLQIKNMATLVGNVANGSPIADTIPCLMALNAKVHLQSMSDNIHTRLIDLELFYLAYRTLDLRADEIIVAISFELPTQETKFKFYKSSQRRDLDISTVNVAIAYQMDFDVIKDIKIFIGGVGATILRLKNTEQSLLGNRLEQKTIGQAKIQMLKEITPLSDLRGSKEYRQTLATNYLDQFLYDWNQNHES